MAIHEHIFGDDRPFAQCHASSLVWLGDDRFLAVWFGGTHEKHGDVGIWGSHRAEGRWSPPRLLAKVAPLPHWNPVLFRPPDGSIHLFFKVGAHPMVWETWTSVSTDDGATWSEPRPLVPDDCGGRGPVKNKPILLSDGAWLAGASIERDDGWDAFVDRSEDLGLTWRASELIELNHEDFPGPGVIQPTLWESQPGHVHMLIRSSCGYLCRSDSVDGGRTWSPVRITDIPNNNSGVDVVRLPDGTLALIYNPVSEDWGPRTPLSIALSFDNGETWSHRIDLETDEGEYSYPAIILAGNKLAATYTWRRERIAFWWGDLDDFGLGF